MIEPKQDNEAAYGRSDSTEVLERLWNAQADEFNQWQALGLDEKLEFAAEVEREACAKVCDEQAKEPECQERAGYCADAIRKRSNV